MRRKVQRCIWFFLVLGLGGAGDLSGQQPAQSWTWESVENSRRRTPPFLLPQFCICTTANGSTPCGSGHFRRVEVVTGTVLPSNLQTVVSGIKPGDQVVLNALVLKNTVEQ